MTRCLHVAGPCACCTYTETKAWLHCTAVWRRRLSGAFHHQPCCSSYTSTPKSCSTLRPEVVGAITVIEERPERSTERTYNWRWVFELVELSYPNFQEFEKFEIRLKLLFKIEYSEVKHFKQVLYRCYSKFINIIMPIHCLCT